MKLTEYVLKKRTVAYVLTVLLIGLGILSYQRLGRLEFPEFTIKTAVVTTLYPGATSMEVEQEITDPIETAIQQLGQVKEVRSLSKAGLSIIYVDIKESFQSDQMPQIWDELRRKVNDIQVQLPPGAHQSMVNDDFGDEYGVFFALTGEGYTYEELKEFADTLKRELLLVKNVASVEIWGDQREIIDLEVSGFRMSELGVTMQDIINTLNRQGEEIDAGKVKVGTAHIRIDPTGGFKSVEELGELLVRSDGRDTLVYLKDVTRISRSYQDPPQWMMRYNGLPAIGIGVATVSDGNVVEMGRAVRQRIGELGNETPVGMELGIIAYQSETVSKSVNDFVINLVEAVAIVIFVLCITMGLASGLMMGLILLLTIFGTFIAMQILGVTLQLVSLGALILALGMLVDNAIVVTEGILIRVQQGMDRTEAARKTVSQTVWPLLGATLVAILAFAAIGTSQNTTGEFLNCLFIVMAVSLGFSWVLAITLTPLFCVKFMPAPKSAGMHDPYSGMFFVIYRRFLSACLDHRCITLAVLVSLLIAAVLGFGKVEQSFFPSSDRPQFMIDYWRPEGTHINETSADLEQVEKYLAQMTTVVSTTTFVGQGALRFLLNYEPEMPNSSFGQLLVTVDDYRNIDTAIATLPDYFAVNFPDAEIKLKKFVRGPGAGAKIEAEFRGSDPRVLRRLSEHAQAIMAKDPVAINIRDDWRQPEKVLRPTVSEAAARRLGITRPVVADTLASAYSGLTVGIYRENNRLLPIRMRLPEDERQSVNQMRDIQVISPATGRGVPLERIVKAMETTWEDPVIRRKNRQRIITAECDPAYGNASPLFHRLKSEIEAIPLPPSYELSWGGEAKDSAEAQESLFRMLPVFALAMVFTVIMLFNALRQPVIIFLCLPLTTIGVTAGLLLFGQPFGFMCLLGFLGLSGMLIKNAVVLIDQIDLEIREGKPPHQAILDSSVSRLRPVSMAALTTVLGMIPLLTDPFYVGMSVTIMSGLTFGTLLTLVVVPVLYAIFFKVNKEQMELSSQTEAELKNMQPAKA